MGFDIKTLFSLKDEEGVRYVQVKPRPPITLLRHYRNPWKAAYHHFQRYSDIRVKGESSSYFLLNRGIQQLFSHGGGGRSHNSFCQSGNHIY